MRPPPAPVKMEWIDEWTTCQHSRVVCAPSDCGRDSIRSRGVGAAERSLTADYYCACAYVSLQFNRTPCVSHGGGCDMLIHTHTKAEIGKKGKGKNSNRAHQHFLVSHVLLLCSGFFGWLLLLLLLLLLFFFFFFMCKKIRAVARVLCCAHTHTKGVCVCYTKGVCVCSNYCGGVGWLVVVHVHCKEGSKRLWSLNPPLLTTKNKQKFPHPAHRSLSPPPSS
jgi:hypothetical protein